MHAKFVYYNYTLDLYINYRAWHYKNYHMIKIGSHFIEQKASKINHVALVIQYSNQLFANTEQLVNIEIEYLFSFIHYTNKPQSNYALTITNCIEKSPHYSSLTRTEYCSRPQHLYFWYWSFDTVMQCEETLLKLLPSIDPLM